MKMEHGPITATQSYVPSFQKFQPTLLNNQDEIRCYICAKYFENGVPIIICNNTNCKMTVHIYCLAKFMLHNSEHILPTHGSCPSCSQYLHFGELISKQLYVFGKKIFLK